MRRGFIFILLSFLWSVRAFPFLVLQLNLEQMTNLSSAVFVGRCEEVKEGKDSNGRLVQYVTYEVTEVLKGEIGDRITFKQLRLMAPIESGQVSQTTVLSELPRYREGEENIVFLSEASDVGLTAPIGLIQGKFEIIRDSRGKKSVRNGTRNEGLFLGLKKNPSLKSLSLTAEEQGLLDKAPHKVPYEEFVSLVKKISGH